MNKSMGKITQNEAVPDHQRPEVTEKLFKVIQELCKLNVDLTAHTVQVTRDTNFTQHSSCNLEAVVDGKLYDLQPFEIEELNQIMDIIDADIIETNISPEVEMVHMTLGKYNSSVSFEVLNILKSKEQDDDISVKLVTLNRNEYALSSEEIDTLLQGMCNCIDCKNSQYRKESGFYRLHNNRLYFVSRPNLSTH